MVNSMLRYACHLFAEYSVGWLMIRSGFRSFVNFVLLYYTSVSCWADIDWASRYRYLQMICDITVIGFQYPCTICDIGLSVVCGSVFRY